MATAISRRVSYILPSPSSPPPLLELPGLGERRRGHTSPFLKPKGSAPNGTSVNGVNGHASQDPFADDPFADEEHTKSGIDHPRHCLGITSLALDTSTVLSDSQVPGGILYSGGRDGLVASWELNIPHKRRKGARYEHVPGRGGKVKWERVGDAAEMFDDEIEENGENFMDDDDWESEDEEVPAEGHGVDFGRVAGGVRRRRSQRGEVAYEDRWAVDTDAIVQSPPETTFRQSAQTHTDWVNAMLLCNLNQTVITASADRTIHAWSPHAINSAPTLVGRHRDYVKSLAWAKFPSLLFSGALDRQIAIWDVNAPDHDTPLLAIDLNKADDWGGVGFEGERGSVYALGVDPTGRVLAAGTPERVIRLWDPRIGDKTIGKLIGHTDCVRSIVMSEDGKHMLTGSSDSTIKLWSLAAHRCLHTFNHHTSSVWSLFSNHPNLERFYSGSRDGILAAVDVEAVGDISDGECVVLAREGWTPGKYGDYESKSGDEGVRCIVGMDDEYVWTATGSAEIKRYRDVGRRIHRLGSHIDGTSHMPNGDGVTPAPHSANGLEAPFAPASGDGNSGIRRPSADENAQSSLLQTESRDSRSVAFAPSPNPRGGSSPSVSGNLSPNNLSPVAGGIPQATRDRLGIQPRRTTFSGASIAGSIMSDASGLDDVPVSAAQNGIPFRSLVSLGIPDSPYGFGISHRSGDLHDQGSVHRDALGLNSNPVAATTQAARDEFEDREVASEATPLRLEPDAVIAGRPGLVRSIILNDRQHVLTVDTDGEVAVWNIVKGECVGRYSTKDVADALHLERGMSAGPAVRKHSVEVLEMVKERIEGETMVITWCAVDTRIGSLVVHLEEGRVFDAEVYADESGLPALEGSGQDVRLNLGKWALGNLFRGLIKAEEREVIASSPTTTLSSLPSVPRSPEIRTIPIERGPANQPHRKRALTGSFSSQKAPTLNIPGLAVPAARAAIVPEEEILLSQSAPTTSNAFQSFQALRGPLSVIAQTPGSGTATGPTSPGESTRGDYFSLNRRNDPSPSRRDSKEPPTPGSVTGSNSQAPATPGGSKLKLKFGKKKKETPMSPVVESKELLPEEDKGPKIPEREAEQLKILDTVRSHAFHPPSHLDAPPLSLPPDTAVLISEESKDAGAWVVTYRSRVSSTEEDMIPLEMNSPLWLLDYLFTGRTKVKDPVKLTFILEPEPGCGLKEMPEGTTRLSASRILRARKILAFIFDKLDLGPARARTGSIASAHSRITALATKKLGNSLSSHTASSSNTAINNQQSITEHSPYANSESAAEDTIELICGKHVVDPKMTLATLKQYYGSGGDMLLYYRPRKGVTLA